VIRTRPPSGVRDPPTPPRSARMTPHRPATATSRTTLLWEPAEVYRKRVADDDDAEQKLAMRWESLNREHDRIGPDRFWEIIYGGFRKAGYTTAQLRHLLGMEIKPK
jgi:hypothetical protein